MSFAFKNLGSSPVLLPFVFFRLDKKFLSLLASLLSQIPISVLRASVTTCLEALTGLFHNLLSVLCCTVSPSQSKSMPEPCLRISGLSPNDLPPWFTGCTSHLFILGKVIQPAMFCPFSYHDSLSWVLTSSTSLTSFILV